MTLYTGALATPNPRSKLQVAMYAGIKASRALGHRPDVPEPDYAKDAAITACVACGAYTVVDLEESPSAYGSGTVNPCTSRPRFKPWGMA